MVILLIMPLLWYSMEDKNASIKYGKNMEKE
jgi:hypothetical protein